MEIIEALRIIAEKIGKDEKSSIFISYTNEDGVLTSFVGKSSDIQKGIACGIHDMMRKSLGLSMEELKESDDFAGVYAIINGCIEGISECKKEIDEDDVEDEEKSLIDFLKFCENEVNKEKPNKKRHKNKKHNI